MQNIFKKSFIRFIFFGGINTLFAYLILALFLFLDFHYAIATLIAAIISVISGYFINKFFVFKSVEAKNIIIYMLFWFAIYNLSIFIQYILLEIIYMQNLYFNSLIATIITTIISFLVNKYYFFRN